MNNITNDNGYVKQWENSRINLFKKYIIEELPIPSYYKVLTTCRQFYVELSFSDKSLIARLLELKKVVSKDETVREIAKCIEEIDRTNSKKVKLRVIKKYDIVNFQCFLSQEEYEKAKLVYSMGAILRNEGVLEKIIDPLSNEKRGELLDVIDRLNKFYAEFKNIQIKFILTTKFNDYNSIVDFIVEFVTLNHQNCSDEILAGVRQYWLDAKVNVITGKENIRVPQRKPDLYANQFSLGDVRSSMYSTRTW